MSNRFSFSSNKRIGCSSVPRIVVVSQRIEFRIRFPRFCSMYPRRIPAPDEPTTGNRRQIVELSDPLFMARERLQYSEIECRTPDPAAGQAQGRIRLLYIF